MKTLITAKQLRDSLPAIVGKVRRGARFTVLCRNQPAFQIVPVDANLETPGDLAGDSLYRANPVGRSKQGRAGTDHDSLLYQSFPSLTAPALW